MKNGDRVRLIDGSWCVSITEKKQYEHENHPAYNGQHREWIVLALDCDDLPKVKDNHTRDKRHLINDAIIIDTMFFEVVYTKEEYLRPINPPKKVCIKVDGKKKYISRESAKALNLID